MKKGWNDFQTRLASREPEVWNSSDRTGLLGAATWVGLEAPVDIRNLRISRCRHNGRPIFLVGIRQVLCKAGCKVEFVRATGRGKETDGGGGAVSVTQFCPPTYHQSRICPGYATGKQPVKLPVEQLSNHKESFKLLEASFWVLLRRSGISHMSISRHARIQSRTSRATVTNLEGFLITICLIRMVVYLQLQHIGSNLPQFITNLS